MNYINTLSLRTDHELLLNAINLNKIHEFNKEKEWNTGDINRDEDQSWIQRYQFESDLILYEIKNNNYKKILEIGSGPGMLSQFIQNKVNVDYTLIDDDGAKQVFDQRNYKGTFLVKNLLHQFDITDLESNFDLVIMNDFLEHICNPSHIIYQCRKITNEKSKIFISVPNLRMGNSFIYRGLFDYDNFIYFMYTHRYNLVGYSPSPLKCQYHPKLDTEKTMEDCLITSWNWYLCFQKIDE